MNKMELANVRKIGPKTLEKLHAYNIFTPEDLVLTFPKHYYFYEVNNEEAFSGEAVCFKARIASRPVLIRARGKAKAFVFSAFVNEIKCKCIIFSGDYLRYKIQPNLVVICYGKYKIKEKEFSLTNLFFDDFACRIELDYGFKDINSKQLSNAIEAVLQSGFRVEDDLPEQYLKKYRLLDKNELLYKVHFPTGKKDCIEANRRIRYEDFFWYASSLESLRLLRGMEEKTKRIYDRGLLERLIRTLPYALTGDQKKALEEILNDFSSSRLMNRLVEGDVGSGKSIVAYLAGVAMITAGFQTALMAPTELLATQHYQSFQALFPFYKTALLTSSVKEKEKEDILFRLMHHRIDFIIGTHSLIQDNVKFSKLGLVIIDEQHRFGVKQRKALIDKYNQVDCLYLTATPIPRTLGLTSFGDLELSLIIEKPANRKAVITRIIPQDSMDVLKSILNKHLARGEQIYVVVPLILENEERDDMDITSALELFQGFMPEARLATLHGKMKASQKDKIMQDFKAHNLDCLISTTVIEVGVDVRNATVMVILSAERYGLSQIHQLRGRVGRGDIQSYCYLVSAKDNVERLNVLEKTTDGFVLAEEDFKLRGPGDYLGDEQSGYQSLHIDFNSKDAIIWKCALEDSKEFVGKYLSGKETSKRLAGIIEGIHHKKTKIN